MRRAALVIAAAACALLAACTATVGGSGHVGLPPGGPSIPSVPGPTLSGSPLPGGPSGGTAQPSVACPKVTDPDAGLSFRCVTSGLTTSSDLLWTLNLVKQVETDWVLGEGATSVPVPAGVSLQQVAGAMREEMVALQYYGPSPTVTTVSSKAATVAGVAAWVLQTTFTIDPAYRSKQHLRVRTERMWLVALQAGSGRVALWYVTLPDDVEQFWPSVPVLIKDIRLL